MKKCEKLNLKIETLKAELAKARAAEKLAAVTVARRIITKAVSDSGLLALVRCGNLTAGQLHAEFASVAVRVAKAADSAAGAATVAHAPEPDPTLTKELFEGNHER